MALFAITVDGWSFVIAVLSLVNASNVVVFRSCLQSARDGEEKENCGECNGADTDDTGAEREAVTILM
eukprot:CAMPEP_0171445282 /NCGR_PEP_ID=MMETSP0881-20121228/35496_1 /TAXON_ID=67004 /ORGANISM="Thalassiosira weissflogii, Strain CCMP1336" /LENGTH=67 /DNA_ID=CAMNT_0011969227 /DNA_START=5 /DNA_END=206 /DNA_ORIENTATION=+